MNSQDRIEIINTLMDRTPYPTAPYNMEFDTDKLISVSIKSRGRSRDYELIKWFHYELTKYHPLPYTIKTIKSSTCKYISFHCREYLNFPVKFVKALFKYNYPPIIAPHHNWKPYVEYVRQNDVGAEAIVLHGDLYVFGEEADLLLLTLLG